MKPIITIVLALITSAAMACPQAPVTAIPVADVVTTYDDLTTNTIPAKYHFTDNLETAREILRCGSLPALWLGDMLFDRQTGLLLPDAQANLYRAVSSYPDVFALQGLIVEVIDEPFWRKTAPIEDQVAAINQSVQWLHAYAPLASLGIVFAPVWETMPEMIPAAQQVAAGLQWVSVDVYALSLNPVEIAHSLAIAEGFGQFVKQNYPQLQRWLVVQGFGPVNEVVPTQWNPSQLAVFEEFLTGMGNIVAANYDGAAIWGWSNTNELPPQYAGKYFPQSLKDFYASKLQ